MTTTPGTGTTTPERTRRIKVRTPTGERTITIRGGYRPRGNSAAPVLVADNGALAHATYVVDTSDTRNVRWAGGLHPRAAGAFNDARAGATFVYQGRRVTKLTDADIDRLLGRHRTLHQVGVGAD